MTRDDRKELVEAGYDRMAEKYLASKDPYDPNTIAALEDLAGKLPPNASVLDLGCGAGVPTTRWLSERFPTVGVDISEKQLELARENAPKARLIKSDMKALDFETESFGAAVSFVAVIHVPREEHAGLFEGIHRWLSPGGYFLATLAVGEWEGEDENWEGWGAPMWWSHYGGGENIRMLESAGFDIEAAEAKSDPGVGSGEETWLWILAKKRNREKKTEA